MDLVWQTQAWEDYLYWQSTDKTMCVVAYDSMSWHKIRNRQHANNSSVITKILLRETLHIYLLPPQNYIYEGELISTC